jgi:hypothetical protein
MIQRCEKRRKEAFKKRCVSTFPFFCEIGDFYDVSIVTNNA